MRMGDDKLTNSFPPNQPCPWNLEGVTEHPLIPRVPYGGSESFEDLMKAWSLFSEQYA